MRIKTTFTAGLATAFLAAGCRTGLEQKDIDVVAHGCAIEMENDWGRALNRSQRRPRVAQSWERFLKQEGRKCIEDDLIAMYGSKVVAQLDPETDVDYSLSIDPFTGDYDVRIALDVALK